MFHKFDTALRNLYRRQRGMTGLETAIILIAFVTVAGVLAYSVLSAGVFSAERGKATVYGGLESASTTMEVKGHVLGLSTDNTTLSQAQFSFGLVMSDGKVDTNSIVVNYFDEDTHSENVTTSFTLNVSSTERGSANILENDEQFTALVTIPAGASTSAYDTFTIQVIPTSGAALTLKRTLPGSLLPVMDLK